MVVVKKIEPQIAELFSPDDISMGFINEFEFNDVRIQIKEQQLEGYYCMLNGERSNITKHGKCDNWFEGFFDRIEIQLMKLM